MNERRIGISYGLTAYGLWGLMPLYLHAASIVAPLELLCHRIVWSFVFIAIVLALGHDWTWLRRITAQPGIVWKFLGSAAALSVNWFVYIWSVAHGRVVDASLGYFINPLVSVVLAVLALKERLRPLQWCAVAVAALGVFWLTLSTGKPPWVGLLLAISFGTYGLLRKTAALDALAGLALETTLLFPPALAYLAWLALSGRSSWSAGDAATRALLVAAGPITAVPLLCFAASARRIPLSLLGILQYLGPTLQLGLGVFVFHEPFPRSKWLGYALIWLSVLTYSLETFYVRTREPARDP